jgi:hypothetical protein
MKWVSIYKAADSIEGHIIKGLLEQESIPVRVVGGDLAGAVGGLPVEVVQVEIHVPEPYAGRARKIALQFEKGRRSSGSVISIDRR